MDIMLDAIENIENSDVITSLSENDAYQVLKSTYDETELERDLYDNYKTVKNTKGDKARAVVGVSASLAAGAAADAALAGAAGTMLEAAFAGAAVAGPIGMILGAAASYCAASAAKSVYDAC